MIGKPRGFGCGSCKKPSGKKARVDRVLARRFTLSQNGYGDILDEHSVYRPKLSIKYVVRKGGYGLDESSRKGDIATKRAVDSGSWGN